MVSNTPSLNLRLRNFKAGLRRLPTSEKMFLSHSKKTSKLKMKKLKERLMKEDKRKKLNKTERTSRLLKNLVNKKLISKRRKPIWNMPRNSWTDILPNTMMKAFW